MSVDSLTISLQNALAHIMLEALRDKANVYLTNEQYDRAHEKLVENIRISIEIR